MIALQMRVVGQMRAAGKMLMASKALVRPVALLRPGVCSGSQQAVGRRWSKLAHGAVASRCAPVTSAGDQDGGSGYQQGCMRAVAVAYSIGCGCWQYCNADSACEWTVQQ